MIFLIFLSKFQLVNRLIDQRGELAEEFLVCVNFQQYVFSSAFQYDGRISRFQVMERKGIIPFQHDLLFFHECL